MPLELATEFIGKIAPRTSDIWEWSVTWTHYSPGSIFYGAWLSLESWSGTFVNKDGCFIEDWHSMSIGKVSSRGWRSVLAWYTQVLRLYPQVLEPPSVRGLQAQQSAMSLEHCLMSNRGVASPLPRDRPALVSRDCLVTLPKKKTCGVYPQLKHGEMGSRPIELILLGLLATP